jgi:hypothetical protein
LKPLYAGTSFAFPALNYTRANAIPQPLSEGLIIKIREMRPESAKASDAFFVQEGVLKRSGHSERSGRKLSNNSLIQ